METIKFLTGRELYERVGLFDPDNPYEVACKMRNWCALRMNQVMDNDEAAGERWRMAVNAFEAAKRIFERQVVGKER